MILLVPYYTTSPMPPAYQGWIRAKSLLCPQGNLHPREPSATSRHSAGGYRWHQFCR